MRFDARLLGLVSVGVFALACGASSPQPASVEGKPAGSSAASAASSAAAAPSKPAEPAAPAAEPASNTASPKDILMRPGVLYTVAFEETDLGKKAVEACSKDSEKDPKKRPACMAKAREKIDFDSYQFTQEKDGTWWWLTLKRKGSSLVHLHRIRFEFGEEKGTTLTINTEGKDMGTSPMRPVPATQTFDIPSDFRISTTDPKYGKLFLDSKMIGTGGN